MNIHIIIKKYTLSQVADTACWGQFNLLTGLDLSDDQYLKLFNFYSGIDSYRNSVMNILSFADGQGYRFVSTPNSVTVYSYFAVVNKSVILNTIKAGVAYEEYTAARDQLFLSLGWTDFQEHVAIKEVTFNKDTNEFVGIPNSYEEIAQLYEVSPLLETILGN